MTDLKWANWRVAGQLREISNAAAQLEIRFGNIIRNAEPAIRRRMEKLDTLDLDVSGFVLSAYALADTLQDEADATAESPQ